jgi:hypothetical protein
MNARLTQYLTLRDGAFRLLRDRFIVGTFSNADKQEENKNNV